MQSFCKNVCRLGSAALGPKFSTYGKGMAGNFPTQTSGYPKGCSSSLLLKCLSCAPSVLFRGFSAQREFLTSCDSIHQFSTLYNCPGLGTSQTGMAHLHFPVRFMATMDHSEKSLGDDGPATIPSVAPRIKFKRPDKTARHIMQILDKEAVGKVRAEREIPDVQPGCIVQLKVEVPENKRRVSLLKGIVIARRNAGLNTTFRLRRMVAGVGVETVYPLYSPNIKEIKVLERKKVRRAKLYYLRDRMNTLRGSKV